MLPKFVCTREPRPAEQLGSSCLSPLKIPLTLLADPPATPLLGRLDQSDQLATKWPVILPGTHSLVLPCSGSGLDNFN